MKTAYKRRSDGSGHEIIVESQNATEDGILNDLYYNSTLAIGVTIKGRTQLIIYTGQRERRPWE